MIQSVKRALDIVALVSHSEEGLRLTELARGLHLHKTTVFNLARTLQAAGYLIRDDAHRYQLGPALDDVARRRAQRGIYQRAGNVMLRLFDALDSATVTFSELVGQDVRCRLRIAPEMPGTIIRGLMWSFSPFASASGVCLQAFNPGFRQALSTSRAFEDTAHRRWETRAAFDQALDDVVRRGLAAMPDEIGWRMAAPVGDFHALGINAPLTDAQFEPAFRLLVESAAAIAAP